MGNQIRSYKLILFLIVLFLIVPLACDIPTEFFKIDSISREEVAEEEETSSGGPSQSDAIEVMIPADEGGKVEHPAGVSLHIPPGALSEDTRVSISNEGLQQPTAGSPTPMMAVAPSFAINTGREEVGEGVILTFPLPTSDDVEIRPSHVAFMHRDERGVVRIRAAVVDEEAGEVRADLARLREPPQPAMSGVESESTTSGVGSKFLQRLKAPVQNGTGDTYTLSYVPVYPGGATELLQVPYYSQSGLSWCTPTSLSMLFSYHGAPYGITENWTLAGMAGMDRDEAKPNFNVLQALSIESDEYEFLWWDGDLIDVPQGEEGEFYAVVYHETLFTSYVKWQLAGFDAHQRLGATFAVQFGPISINVPVPDISYPPRPVQTTADAAEHAFVIVGADEDSVWTHDSSGAVGGKRPADEMSWEDFSKEALVEGDGDVDRELRTVVYHGNPRPEAERRGSIVLGRQNKSGPDNSPKSSIVYIPPYYDDIQKAYWVWDGDPHPQGYFWFANHAGAGLVSDNKYNFAFELLGKTLGTVEFDVWIANVTDQARDYDLDVEIHEMGGSVLSQNSYTLHQGAYDWAGDHISDVLDTSAITSPGEYELVFHLFHSGTLQDEKAIGFNVVQGDAPPPGLEIVSPEDEQAFTEGDSISFMAEVTDYDRTEEDYSISWRYDRDGLEAHFHRNTASGESFSTDGLCDGSYTVTAEGRNPFTGKTAEDSVSFVVQQPENSSPPDVCAPSIAILMPRAGTNYRVGDTLQLKAEIDDDRPETPNPIYPVTWRENGSGGPIIGRGLNASTKLGEGVTAVYVEYGPASDTVNLSIVETENQPPDVVEILEPDHGEDFHYYDSGAGMNGYTVYFQGRASDPEDGELTGSNLVWYYRPVGTSSWTQMGTGTNVSYEFRYTSDWANYEILLEVVDSEGLSGPNSTDKIEIGVQGPPS